MTVAQSVSLWNINWFEPLAGAVSERKC